MNGLTSAPEVSDVLILGNYRHGAKTDGKSNQDDRDVS